MSNDPGADTSTPAAKQKKGAPGAVAGLVMLMVAGTARYCDDIGRFAVSHIDDIAVNHADDLGRLATQTDDAARAAGQSVDISEDLGAATKEAGRIASEEALKAAGDRDYPERSNQVDWQQLKCKVTHPEMLVRNVEVFRKECGLPLVFRAGPNAALSERIEHSCGAVVRTFVQAMPSPTDPVARSEEVLELGPAGGIAHRWWAPVGVVVEGVIGNELIIRAELDANRPSSVHLAIDPEGKFRALPGIGDFQRTPMPCPASQDLPKSASLECWQLTEKSSGTGRLMAYEGPCR